MIVLSNSRRRQKESLTSSGPASAGCQDGRNFKHSWSVSTLQYNIKIFGFPETDTNESASTITALCLKFFTPAGVEISCYDNDIAHRVPKIKCIFWFQINSMQIYKKNYQRTSHEQTEWCLQRNSNFCRYSSRLLFWRCEFIRWSHSPNPITYCRCQEI